MKQLNNIIDTLAKIVDKTITVTVNYVTKGKPSTSSSKTKTEGIGGYATGGPVFKRLRNPHLPGWGQEDDVPALLTKGEFVFKKEAVKKYGVNFLHALNSMRLSPTLVPKFATGGLVGNITKGFNNFSALGKHSVGKLSSVFSSTLQRFKTGGNVASDDLQNTILSITERYNRLIQNARDTGDRDIELVLQKELIEIQRIAEELQRQLELFERETEKKLELIREEEKAFSKERTENLTRHRNLQKYQFGSTWNRMDIQHYDRMYGYDIKRNDLQKKWAEANEELAFNQGQAKFDAEASIKKIQTDSILERQKIENNLKDEIAKLEDAMLQEIERARKEVATVTPLQGRGSKGIAWFNKGGFVDKVQGAIKGKDSVNAMLTPGEYVMKESVVRALGANFFENLNKWGRMAVRPLHFAEGGLVPGSSLPTSSSIQESSMRIDLNLNGRGFAMKSDPSTAKMLARELRKLKLTTA